MRLALRHLGGQHDQKTHGRNSIGRRGGKYDVTDNDGTLSMQKVVKFQDRGVAIGPETNSAARVKSEGAAAAAAAMPAESRMAMRAELNALEGYEVNSMMIRGTGMDMKRNVTNTLGDDFDVGFRNGSSMLTLNELAMQVTSGHQAGFTDEGYQKYEKMVADYKAARGSSDLVGTNLEKVMDGWIVDRMAADFGITPEAGFFSIVNSGWAKSSQSAASVAVQAKIGKMRGLPMLEGSWGLPESMGWLGSHTTDTAEVFTSKFGASIDGYISGNLAHVANVRAAAQQATGGDKTPWLFRGVKDMSLFEGAVTAARPNAPGSKPRSKYKGKLRTNPLSSWSTSQSVAGEFATDYGTSRNGGVLSTRVDWEDVFSVSGWSGHGALNEYEVVIMSGGRRPVEFDGALLADRAANEEDETVMNIDEVDDADWIKKVKHLEVEIEPVTPRMALRHPGHSPQKVHAGKGAAAAKELAEPDGGFTFSSAGPATTGFAVAMEGTSTFMGADELRTPAGKAKIAAHLRSVRDSSDGANAIGGWHDPSPNSPGQAIVLDRVRVFPSSQRAAAVSFAKKNNQKAIADLDAITAGDWDNAFVDTGGTGDSRGTLTIHGPETTADLRDPAGHDRRGDREAGRADRQRLGGTDRRRGRIVLRHATHDQKSHGRGRGGGMPTASSGMDGLPDDLQARINKKIETEFGMPADQAEQMVVDNLVDAAMAGNPADAGWYDEANAWTEDVAASTEGRPVEIDDVQVAGITAATSSQLDWDQNKKVADGVVDVMSKDAPFDVSQEMIDDYNAYVGNRTRRSDDFQTVDLKPGRYRPSEIESLGFLAGQHPTLPAVRNGENMVRGLRIARGEPIDSVLKGPKHRSFVTNIVRPDLGGTATMDTWHYQAAVGGHKFNGTVGGGLGKHTFTMAEWRSTEFMGQRFGLETVSQKSKATRTPQDFFQSSPSMKKYNFSSGTYPWFVGATKKATAAYNTATGSNLLPHEFQAQVWIHARKQEW